MAAASSRTGDSMQISDKEVRKLIRAESRRNHGVVAGFLGCVRLLLVRSSRRRTSHYVKLCRYDSLPDIGMYAHNDRSRNLWSVRTAAGRMLVPRR
jgi:hypothetical protein